MPTAFSGIADWLRDEARRIVGMGALIDAFAECLRRDGIPLVRMTLSVQTLHPQMLVAARQWTLEDGGRDIAVPYGIDVTAQYLDSPIRTIFEGGAMVRRRLRDPDVALDYSILPELKDQGVTDYLVLPVTFSDGRPNAMTFATRAPDGFGEDQVAAMSAAVPVLAPLLEIQSLRQISRTVLETYLGAATGPKVLEGTIRRGDSEMIDAVLWFCDLRNFTVLSEGHPPTEVIGLLNSYFEAVCGALEAHGGEVLKFIGDAVLAIFPLSDGADVAEVCGKAVAASRDALAAVAELGDPRVRFGIALHLGRVAYGNIGAPDRLDFTVIGPPVNKVTRIEGLCGGLGETLLASRDFAVASGLDMRTVGSYALKGIEGDETVYRLPDID